LASLIRPVGRAMVQSRPLSIRVFFYCRSCSSRATSRKSQAMLATKPFRLSPTPNELTATTRRTPCCCMARKCARFPGCGSGRPPDYPCPARSRQRLGLEPVWTRPRGRGFRGSEGFGRRRSGSVPAPKPAAPPRAQPPLEAPKTPIFETQNKARSANQCAPALRKDLLHVQRDDGERWIGLGRTGLAHLVGNLARARVGEVAPPACRA